MSLQFLAARSVRCPKCPAMPGELCSSTGGGNFMNVPVHAKRVERIEDWTPQQMMVAVELVRAQSTRSVHSLSAGYYDVTEAAAKPIVKPAAKPPTPRGVRLSQAQAAAIELAAQSGGILYVSTAHFRGDAARRKVANAVLERGIFRDAGLNPDQYGRDLALTWFGWQVYRQHSAVIRRLDDVEAAELEERARSRELKEAS